MKLEAYVYIRLHGMAAMHADMTPVKRHSEMARCPIASAKAMTSK